MQNFVSNAWESKDTIHNKSHLVFKQKPQPPIFFSTPHEHNSHLKSVGPTQLLLAALQRHSNSTASTCRSVLPHQSIESSQSVLKCVTLTCVHRTVKPHNRFTDC